MSGHKHVNKGRRYLCHVGIGIWPKQVHDHTIKEQQAIPAFFLVDSFVLICGQTIQLMIVFAEAGTVTSDSGGD